MVARDYENPADADEMNDYEVTVKITDADGNTASVSFTVSVTDVVEQATLSLSAPSTLEVNENSAYSGTPTLTGTPIGSATWSLSGDDAGDFTIDAGTGEVKMVARDYEDPADADEGNDYEVTVKVEDEDGNTASVSFTVTVNDVTETSALSITAPSTLTVSENSAYSGSPTLTGTPIGSATWSLSGDDAGDFTIDAGTGEVEMVARDYENPADADEMNDYEVTVKITDADGNTASVSFTVSVTDVVEQADLSLAAPTTLEVNENSAYSGSPSLTGTPIGTATWSLSGDDAGDFTIDAGTGEVEMVARDYENPADADGMNDYEVTVAITDADDNTASVSFTVTVNDVTETTTLSVAAPTTLTVNENSAYSGTPTLTGTPIGSVTWSLSGTDASDFTIDAGTGEVKMVARNYEDPDDADGMNDYEVTVKVEDEDGNTASVSFTVTVNDVVEVADKAGYVVTPKKLTIDEGDSAEVTIALQKPPTSPMRITPTDHGRRFTVAPASGEKWLTFTSSNWSVPQTITVTATEDLIAWDSSEPVYVRWVVRTADEGYIRANFPDSVRVTINDNDTAGVEVDLDPDTPGIQLTRTVDEGLPRVGVGGNVAIEYTIRLKSKPSYGTVAIFVNSTGGISVSPPSDLSAYQGNLITFDYRNWNVHKRVTVHLNGSLLIDDPRVATITHTLPHTGHNRGNGYSGVVVPTMELTINDITRDHVGFTTVGTWWLPDTLKIRPGSSQVYSIGPKVVPTQDVTVTLTPSDPAVVTIDTDPDTPGDQDTITFRPEDFNAAFVHVDGELVAYASPENEAGLDLVRVTGVSSGIAVISITEISTTDPHYATAPTEGGDKGVEVGTGAGFLNEPRTQDFGFFTLSPPYFIGPPENQTSTAGVEFDFKINKASDARGDAITYTASQADGSPLPSWLAFDPDTLTFSGVPGPCDVTELQVRVTATDDGNVPQSDAVTFTLTVAPDNNLPPDFCNFKALYAPDDQTATVGVEFTFQLQKKTSNVGSDAITYTASQADGSPLPSWLVFDANTLTFSGVPGPCDVTELELRVTATDDGDVLQTDAVTSTLTVEPGSNQPPEFCGVYTLSMAENSLGGVNVGAPVTAIDPNGDALRYIALDGSDGRSFNLNADTGQITTREGVTYDYETKPFYSFTVIVEEQGTYEGYLSGVDVTVNLIDVDEDAANDDSTDDGEPDPPPNRAPAFDSTAISMELAENSPPATKVGSPITATDPDGDTLTYSLSGTDSASFTVSPGTGQISTITGVTYDYETTKLRDYEKSVSEINWHKRPKIVSWLSGFSYICNRPVRTPFGWRR